MQDYSTSSNDRQQVLTSVGENFIDIKRLGLERDVIKEWKTVEVTSLRANDRNLASSAFISEFGTLLNNILTVVVLFIGVLMVFDGDLSAGVLIGVNMLIGKFSSAQSLVRKMKKLSQLLDSFASAEFANFTKIVQQVIFGMTLSVP